MGSNPIGYTKNKAFFEIIINDMCRLLEIEGYNGDYFITDEGEVISNKGKKQIALKKRINSHGYYYVNLCKNGKYKSISIHRLVGLYFVKKLKDEYDVLNHIDGNKLNNNYKNLEWCTQSHNTKEAIRIGLFKTKKGKKSNLYSGKLDIKKADEIRLLRNNYGLSYSKIAKMFNVSKSTIINVCKNRIYTVDTEA